MDLPDAPRLEVFAAVLAALVAAIHLLHPSQGGVAILVYAQVGYLGDPRPLLFTLGGFALICGVLLWYHGFAGRWLYLGGIVVALVHLLAYPAWHTVLEHGAFWPHLPGYDYEDTGAVEVVVTHLADEPLALASKLLELVLLGCLLVLYVSTGRDGHAVEGEASSDRRTRR